MTPSWTIGWASPEYLTFIPEPSRCARHTAFKLATVWRLICVRGEYFWLKKLPPLLGQPFVGSAAGSLSDKAAVAPMPESAGTSVGAGLVAGLDCCGNGNPKSSAQSAELPVSKRTKATCEEIQLILFSNSRLLRAPSSRPGNSAGCYNPMMS